MNTLRALAWKAPKTSKTPVYRLYNPNAGEITIIRPVQQKSIDREVTIMIDKIKEELKNLNTHANSYVFFVNTDALKDYSIYFNFILASDNDEYKGIQYIKMTSDGQLLFEAGAVPQLENHS